jgi:hypothetical protein
MSSNAKEEPWLKRMSSWRSVWEPLRRLSIRAIKRELSSWRAHHGSHARLMLRMRDTFRRCKPLLMNSHANKKNASLTNKSRSLTDARLSRPITGLLIRLTERSLTSRRGMKRCLKMLTTTYQRQTSTSLNRELINLYLIKDYLTLLTLVEKPFRLLLKNLIS